MLKVGNKLLAYCKRGKSCLLTPNVTGDNQNLPPAKIIPFLVFSPINFKTIKQLTSQNKYTTNMYK